MLDDDSAPDAMQTLEAMELNLISVLQILKLAALWCIQGKSCRQ
ncbi:hypothetical protein [Chroogloeocystis siderophila]|nr:hypothetical protein [Chroogloeocystis siderophila]